MVNAVAVCAGIGGLEVGLRILWPDLRTVCHIERESFAAATLVSRMEEQAIHPALVADDIESFDGRPFRHKIHILSAGIPCQPFSVAGLRRGKADHRWLGDEFLRLCDEIRPRAIVMENVPGFIQHGLSSIIGGLEEIEAGWRAEWGVFRADRTVFAPHRRARFFLAAERVPNTLRYPVWHQPERGESSAQEGDEGYAQPRNLGEDLADATSKRLQEPTERICNKETRRGVPTTSGLSEDMAHADRGGRSRERVAEHVRQQGASGDQPDGYGADWRFLWPPGPHDAEGWKEYIAAGGPAPVSLADTKRGPRAQRGTDGRTRRVREPFSGNGAWEEATQSKFRRGSHGDGTELEFAKERLRALGNSCIPIATAFAIAKLVRRLRDA